MLLGVEGKLYCCSQKFVTAKTIAEDVQTGQNTTKAFYSK